MSLLNYFYLSPVFILLETSLRPILDGIKEYIITDQLQKDLLENVTSENTLNVCIEKFLEQKLLP